MSASNSQTAKDARSLLYDLVVACRAYDSTKPAHVKEYGFALDAAEAFLQTPRQSGPHSRDAVLEEAAKRCDEHARRNDYGASGAMACAAAIRALKDDAPQGIVSEVETTASRVAPARASSEVSDSEWRRRYEEEYATVDRCWRALGITTYEGANGKAIDEIIRERCASSEAGAERE